VCDVYAHLTRWSSGINSNNYKIVWVLLKCNLESRHLNLREGYGWPRCNVKRESCPCA
jgi:hypothetical protein